MTMQRIETTKTKLTDCLTVLEINIRKGKGIEQTHVHVPHCELPTHATRFERPAGKRVQHVPGDVNITHIHQECMCDTKRRRRITEFKTMQHTYPKVMATHQQHISKRPATFFLTVQHMQGFPSQQCRLRCHRSSSLSVLPSRPDAPLSL